MKNINLLKNGRLAAGRSIVTAKCCFFHDTIMEGYKGDKRKILKQNPNLYDYTVENFLSEVTE